MVAVTPAGTIPAVWANLQYLSILSLTGNKIKGKLAVVVPVAVHLTARSAALGHPLAVRGERRRVHSRKLRQALLS